MASIRSKVDTVRPMTDQLSTLLERFDFQARFFYSGTLCGASTFDYDEGVGHLHLLQKGTLTIEGNRAERLELSEPTLVLFARPSFHRLSIGKNQEATLLCASVSFGAGSTNPLTASLPDVLALPLAEIPELAATLALLFDEGFAQRDGRRMALNRLMELLMLQLLRHLTSTHQVHSGPLSGLADARLSRALAVFHSQPSKRWSLQQLAQAAGMSRTSFAQRFRQVVGTTPAGYLTSWRLSAAMALLRDGRPVKSIALDVGYASASSLSRAFVAKHGLSPKEWLERCKRTER